MGFRTQGAEIPTNEPTPTPGIPTRSCPRQAATRRLRTRTEDPDTAPRPRRSMLRRTSSRWLSHLTRSRTSSAPMGSSFPSWRPSPRPRPLPTRPTTSLRGTRAICRAPIMIGIRRPCGIRSMGMRSTGSNPSKLGTSRTNGIQTKRGIRSTGGIRSPHAAPSMGAIRSPRGQGLTRVESVISPVCHRRWTPATLHSRIHERPTSRPATSAETSARETARNRMILSAPPSRRARATLAAGLRLGTPRGTSFRRPTHRSKRSLGSTPGADPSTLTRSGGNFRSFASVQTASRSCGSTTRPRRKSQRLSSTA